MNEYATATIHQDDRGRLTLEWIGDQRAVLCSREVVELFVTARNENVEMHEWIDRVCNLESLSFDGEEPWVVEGRALLARIEAKR